MAGTQPSNGEMIGIVIAAVVVLGLLALVPM
jgi:hypothetical protein